MSRGAREKSRESPRGLERILLDPETGGLRLIPVARFRSDVGCGRSPAAIRMSRSARMSSRCSIPTQSRIMSGVTPAFACSSSESWRCVVEAGCAASDFVSPMFTSREKSCSLHRRTGTPASNPPSIPNERSAEGRPPVYFWASS
jgi:hypothetical protein